MPVSRKKVLVVDDDAGVRETLSEQLRMQGFDVSEAADGLSAWTEIRQNAPHVVLLDLAMPRLGGLETLKTIRAFDLSIVTVVVTGLSDPDLHRRALELGAVAVLEKPVGGTQLAQVLGRPALLPPAPARVLVVDDDAEVRETLEELLASHGFEVATAPNGDLAMQAIARRAPDVVLLDVVMPGLSGVEILQAIQTIAPRVKVIMVSGGATPEQAMRTLALGAFDFVRKPVDTAYLLRSIDVAVGMKQLESR
ncbi:MAG: response regulator [Candidatus Rokubacteria bacterium]|nr:response regulator [Candidatus Rokubacteria bacterium]